MAGYREFQTGEVLTAANVNDFLMDQSVMKFADAAARDTALGTAVGGGNALREGMVAYLDSTDEVLKYDGTAWDSVVPVVAGIGTNVVQAVKTDTFSTTSTSFTDVTGLTVTITPSSATAKILIIVQLTAGTNVNGGGWRLNGNGGATTYIGDAAGSRTRVLSGVGGDGDADGIAYGQGGVFLASPASTSAQTYKVEALASGSSTYHINRTHQDADSAANYRFASSITAIEVAA